jgi:hypothetical protein
MTCARYLNGGKWCDLGPQPDLTWLYLLACIAMVVCGGCDAADAGWRCHPEGRSKAFLEYRRAYHDPGLRLR